METVTNSTFKTDCPECGTVTLHELYNPNYPNGLIKCLGHDLSACGFKHERGQKTMADVFTTCPSCKLEKLYRNEARNAVSRNGSGIYICNDCGEREAFGK